MSRRKQSNPKSFKSDLECEESEMVVADEWDSKLADASSTIQSSKSDGVMPDQQTQENNSNTDINIPALSSYFSEANSLSPNSNSNSKHSVHDNSEEESTEHLQTKAGKTNSMKKEFSTPSPPSSPGKPSRSDGDANFLHRQVSAQFLKNAVDPTHLNALLQGMPLLSTVLPALQRLAPVSPSAISSSNVGGILCVCGVKFSSSSNLEAHKAFYCSHRQGSDDKGSKKEGSQSPVQDEEDDESTLLKCPHCSYTTTHKLSLNGHMNIHTHQDDPLAAKIPSVSVKGDIRASDRYCVNCDIQFSSFKTFRVHKAHYCQTRHVLKNSKSPVREEASSSSQSISNLASSLASGNSGHAQPILALPTNPVLLLPYSIVAGAQLLPPQYLPQATFLLPNGQMHPLPSAAPVMSTESTILSPIVSPEATNFTLRKTPVMSPSPELTPSQESHNSKEATMHTKKHIDISLKRKSEEIPLDLTTKRAKLSVKSDLLNEDEKENIEINGELKSKLAILKAAGEFEGKLLASPQPSPSGEMDRKLSKSPRTNNISLTSPPPKDTISSSPKASTSSRSPNRSSPISCSQESLPPLLPGLPLISEMDPLTISNLQCLQNFKNMPRELVLKLMSPETLFNGINPVINPPVMVKQGEAKCNNCSIVFYKEESLQVHKKHYCPGREVSKTSEDEPKSMEGSSNNSENMLKSPVSDSYKPQKETSKSSSSLLQYGCTACGIKFSSTDNLTAHQTYYCLKRDNSGDESVTKGLWRCPRCKVVMTDVMQAAHQCTSPSPTSSHGWKCPCCPVLSPTATAAQKHLETHAGIKAFRCTICGYRGNTLRGMRTHIRMHFEKRTNDLQEENFIACILEDDEQKGRSMNGIENSKLLDSSRLLLENPSLSLIMNEAALPDKTESPLSCSYCPFVTLIRSSFIQHLAIAHSIGQESKLYQELKSLLVNEHKATTSLQGTERTGDRKMEHSPLQDFKTEQTTEKDSRDKSPKLDSKPTSPSTAVVASSVASDSQNGFCYCQLCNISFTRLESYMAHKRFYCNRPQSTTPPETAVQ